MNYGFEYSGPEDLSRVTMEQMSDAELLKRLQHMFAQLKVLPAAQDEYHAKRPPPDVSCLKLCPRIWDSARNA